MPKKHFYFAIAVSLFILALGYTVTQVNHAGWGLLVTGAGLLSLTMLAQIVAQLSANKKPQGQTKASYNSGEVSHV